MEWTFRRIASDRVEIGYKSMKVNIIQPRISVLIPLTIIFFLSDAWFVRLRLTITIRQLLPLYSGSNPSSSLLSLLQLARSPSKLVYTPNSILKLCYKIVYIPAIVSLV